MFANFNLLKLAGQLAQVEHVDGSVDFSGFGSSCSTHRPNDTVAFPLDKARLIEDAHDVFGPHGGGSIWH